MNTLNNIKQKRYVIVAGAGISMSQPSNLPSWWQYNKTIINVIKEQACELCPEASELIDAIDIENTLPVQCISDLIVSQGAGSSYFPLLELLNATSPNANHFALVELAKRGILKAVVTTNFDTLIENAFLQKAVPLLTIVQNEEYYELSQALTCKLFKIHGSVTDYDSLIDTVTQKAVGLSPAKRLVLSNIFLNSEIIFIGFSGADLDFDMEYIPISQALERGNNVTWILQPGSHPNTNVKEFIKKYPDNFHCFEKNLSELFNSLGIDYNRINNILLNNVSLNDYALENCVEQMKEKIHELFTSPHIGIHGCVGYCISLLNMIGLDTFASKLAEIYEKHINLKTIDIFCVAGLRALSLQMMRERKFEKCIQYNSAIIKCLAYMDKLFKQTNEGNIEVNALIEKQHREHLMNLAATLSNQALAYFYNKDLDTAKMNLEKAKEYAEDANEISVLAVTIFNLARVNYEKEHDYDKFLGSLIAAKEYAKNAGNLVLLVEILLEESKVRLEIGEYYLTNKTLDEISHHIKNIGDFNFHINSRVLRAKFFLRIGNINESLECFKETVNLIKEKGNVYLAQVLFVDAVKMYDYDSDLQSFADILCSICGIDDYELRNSLSSPSELAEEEQISLPEFIMETLPVDESRQKIIICEYKKEKKCLPVLFSKLCKEYLNKGDWSRLHDEAECYYNAAETKSDRSLALYYLGCADMENGKFADAANHFESVISLGKKANPYYWVWANIELAKIEMQRNNIDASIRLYKSGKNALYVLSDISEIVNACMSYVQQLFNKGYLEEAVTCAESLLKEIHDTGLRKSIVETINIFDIIRRKEEKETALDVKVDSPQKIANEAIRLYYTEKDAAYAWELIQIAKEKYEIMGDMDGVGRCENNIADFYNKEGKIEEALVHYENAMNIKKGLDDIKGVINQLSNIIGLYIMKPNSISVDKFVNDALLHMPEYDYFTEKYRLFCALFIYYLLNSQYAEAFRFAKLAYEGLDYLTGEDAASETKKMLVEFIDNMESAFREPEMPEIENDYFRGQILEATRMYKSDNYLDCCALLDGLFKEVQSDNFKLGIVKGTYGSACLHIRRYQEAIIKFMEAKDLFSDVKEKEKSEAKEHICTAVNGITQALDCLGRGEEVIEILRKEISLNGLSDKARFSYTISLCNRLIKQNHDNMVKDDSLFLEILDMLNDWKNFVQLAHEEKGVLYSTFGLLYRVVSNIEGAEKYYQLARKEFLITNSLHLKSVDLSLKLIYEEKN